MGDATQTNDPPSASSGILTREDAEKVHWTPETVLSTLPHRPQTNSTSPIQFFHTLERLKTNKREGWRRFGIDRGESIADHMYRMSILTMLAPPSLASRLNIAHCTKMALIHDMAESLVGDITPVDGVAKPEKSRREAETMDYLCKDLLGNVSGGLAGEEIRRVWQEYEDGLTLESKFVHDIDKMELVLQMLEYERSHEKQPDLSEFSWVATKIELPEIKAWCEEVLEERKRLYKSWGKVPSEHYSTQHEKNLDEYYGK
ncbi:HD domain-containing protein [Rhizodiscina lignyota]|uniref:5'-deoxynucleotidase n=1 Tax=Rhizodiscina lignyota TaxID=1504668 RepID=A0A9P4IHV7_9PEZI|nr:HD domain-containing protein [Rhizodiscina lignyota]